MDLNCGWAFAKGRAWRKWLASPSGNCDEVVDLPHCWNAKDSFLEDVTYYRGYGSYRKHFSLPARTSGDEDSVWTLESGGFYGTGDVWLNGSKIAEVDGQYLGFSLDVGNDLLWNSENIIGIRLTNKCSSYVLPGIDDPDFLLYGGLAGGIWLQKKPRVHLDSSCASVRTQQIRHNEFDVTIGCTAVNQFSASRSCSLKCSVRNKNGSVVAEASADPNAATGEFAVSMRVFDVDLWSPASPTLYRAECTLLEGGNVIDSIEIPFGFRSAVFEPWRGFFLNGERIELRGVNRHECMPGFGNALPLQQHRKDALLIKQMGCNFVRLSHYPQHPAFLDACDELGILVYAEIATWKSVCTGRWLKSACRQMRDMIRRDRNHPSIILWGMGNESRSQKAYTALREIAEQEDGTRAVTYAENHLYRAKREKTLGIPDVWGCNYEFDAMEEGRDASRLKCVIVTECSNYPPAVRGNLEEEANQVELIEQDLAKIAGKPYVAGFAIWCFSDYATMRKKRYMRHCGLFDAMRRPKMAAAFMQAKYGAEHSFSQKDDER